MHPSTEAQATTPPQMTRAGNRGDGSYCCDGFDGMGDAYLDKASAGSIDARRYGMTYGMDGMDDRMPAEPETIHVCPVERVVVDVPVGGLGERVERVSGEELSGGGVVVAVDQVDVAGFWVNNPAHRAPVTTMR